MPSTPMNPTSALDTDTTSIAMPSTQRKVKHLKKIIKRRITRDKNGNQIGEIVEESYIPIDSHSHVANENADFASVLVNADYNARTAGKNPNLSTSLPLGRQKQSSLHSSSFSLEQLSVTDKIISIDLTGDTSDDEDRETYHISRTPSRPEIKREQEYLRPVLSPGTNLPLSPSTASLSTPQNRNHNVRSDARNHAKDMSIIPHYINHEMELNTSNAHNIKCSSLTIDTITSPSPSPSPSSSLSSLSVNAPHRTSDAAFSILSPAQISTETSIISLRQDRNKEHDGERLRRLILPESVSPVTQADLRKPSPVSSQLLISSSTPQSPSTTSTAFNTQTSSTNIPRKGIGSKPDTSLLSTKSSMKPSPSRVRSGYHVPSFTTSSSSSALLTNQDSIHLPSNTMTATYPLSEPPFSRLSPVFHSPQSSFPITSPVTLTLPNTRERKSLKQPELSSPTSKRGLSFHPRRVMNSLQAQSEFPREKQLKQLEQQQQNDQRYQVQQDQSRRKSAGKEEMGEKLEELQRDKKIELKLNPKNITTLTSAFLASPPPPLFTQTISNLPLRSHSSTESSLPLSLISSFTPKTTPLSSSPSYETPTDVPHTSSLPLNLDLELGFEAESFLSPLDIFLRAVFIGDAKTVVRILDDSAKKAENDPDKNKSSFLHLLPENQYQALFHMSTKLERKLPIASLALERGADINAHEKKSLTSSLALAVQFGPPCAWQFLIEKGADLHCGSLSFNCVQHAILQRNISFLYDCVHHGVDIDISHVRIQLAPDNIEIGKKKRKEWEPEREKRNSPTTIGTGVMRDMGYGSPLQFAVMMGQFSIIPDLLQILTKENKCAFDVNPDPVQYQWSLLHQLVVSSSFTLQEEIIIQLVELGANLEAVDENGQTPFLSALQFNNTQAALALLECGANPTVIDARGQNALHIILSSTVTLGLESVLRKICKIIVEKQATEEGAKIALTQFLLAKSDMLQMRTIDWIQIMHRDVLLSLESTSPADDIRSDFKIELAKWTELKRIVTVIFKHYKITDLPESL